MKVAGLAVWCAAQRRTKLTDEQVPLSLSTPASALTPEQGTIDTNWYHRPVSIVSLVSGAIQAIHGDTTTFLIVYWLLLSTSFGSAPTQGEIVPILMDRHI